MSSPSLSSLILATLFLLLTYLFRLTHTAPNPPPAQRSPHDTSITPHNLLALSLYRHILTILWLLHIAITLYHPTPPSLVCPWPQNLNPALFTATPYTLTASAAILAGSFLRLRAYSDLGRTFTFALTRPPSLVTAGVYAYLQHPSYTGLFFVSGGVLALLARSDSGAGCFVSPEVMRGWGLDLLAKVVLAGIAGVGGWKIFWRIREEEGMMREAFGGEWEEWARRTWRVLPGVW